MAGWESHRSVIVRGRQRDSSLPSLTSSTSHRRAIDRTTTHRAGLQPANASASGLMRCGSTPKCDPTADRGQHTDLSAEISFGVGVPIGADGDPTIASISEVISRSWPHFAWGPASMLIYTLALDHP